ncbi:protein of unknown function [Cupriavidus taiwanensis]|uniref:Uncharacterized protein n=1 Tax=Cupriavidus taiwanensis TaxID=164546 RepID=A0A9Q7XQ35_9BURK|nr:protein of unknown function [Cupriavidus taiwanensis]
MHAMQALSQLSYSPMVLPFTALAAFSPELTTVSSEAKIIYQSLIFASSRFSFFRLPCPSIIRPEKTKDPCGSAGPLGCFVAAALQGERDYAQVLAEAQAPARTFFCVF